MDCARRDLAALGVVLRDLRTPWYATLVAGLTVGLAASPIDPIPDVIPVLGHIDDAVFIPLGAYLTWQLTPAPVKAEAREQTEPVVPGWLSWAVGGGVVLGWLPLGVVLVRAIMESL